MSKSIEQRIIDLEDRARAKEEAEGWMPVILYETEPAQNDDPKSTQKVRILSHCGEVLAERKPHECEEEFLGRYYRERRLQRQRVRVFIPHNHRDDAQ